MSEIKPNNVTDIDENLLKKLIHQKTFREFLQFLIESNKKGENGLLVQKIRESLSEDEEEIINNEIEEFNNKINDQKLWEMQTDEFFMELNERFTKNNMYDPQQRISYLLLFSMNYVFFSYADKSFRKFLGVKKISPFKFF